jgi:hypothetical protein
LQKLIESENIDLKLIAMSQKAANIHLRLGDFIQNGLPIPSKEYYGKNYDAVKKSFSSILVNLYSDDIEAAKEYLSDLDLQFPELQRPLNSFELLMVLSNSKVFIASTSTLAWWASKLGKDAGNLVYHPFGGALDL